MIAIVASLEPEVAPLVPDRWSTYKIKLRLPALPLLLKVGLLTIDQLLCSQSPNCMLCVVLCLHA